MSGNPRVFIPMHRGADNFMSEEAFEKFYVAELQGTHRRFDRGWAYALPAV